MAEGNTGGRAMRVLDRPDLVKDPGMCGRSLCGTGRSRLWPSMVVDGPHREGEEPKPMMDAGEKSDSAIVARKPLPGRDACAVAGVLAVALSGQDPPVRVRPPRGGLVRPARAQQTGDLQLPGLHLRLRQEPSGAASWSNGGPAATAFEPSSGRSRRRCDQPITAQVKWLRQVATGFFAYHAVPTNCSHLSGLIVQRKGCGP
jgi:hypothetical protein